MNYPDIYFHPDYARAHELIEKGQAVQFLHQSARGTVSHTFIKRMIENIEEDQSPCYDIISPYGYGGPVVLEGPMESRPELLAGFMLEFSDYCRENHIISEFIRFHPIEANHLHLGAYYEISPIKKTLGTNLIDHGDHYLTEFTKKCRKTIEKCISMGMTFSINSDETSLDAFCDIYTSTMDRNNALTYYYFDRSYFVNLLRLFPDHTFIGSIFFEGQPIAAGLFMHFGRYVHAHLSGTLKEFIKLSPAYLLKAEVARWSREHGYHFVHYGGGYTNSENDSLYKFKKAFSQNTEFDFCVGKRIWDEAVYNQLTLAEQGKGGVDLDFFPAYRQRC